MATPPAGGQEQVRKDPDVAFLLDGIPVVKFRPEDYVRKPQRPRWSSSTDFIFACLAFAIGFGNLQVPYLCHKNGGAVFFIPYFLALILIAVPLVVLESVLGHLMQRGCLTAWNLTPIFKGVGIASLIMLIWRNAYYIVPSVWAGYYAFQVIFRPYLPWKYCNNVGWNTADCRTFDRFYSCVWQNQTSDYIFNHTGRRYIANNISAEASALLQNVTICEKVRSSTEEFFHEMILRQSKSIEDVSAIRIDLAIGLAIAYGLILMCVLSGIKVLGKLVYVLLLVPYLIMVAMLLRSFGLPGIFSGVLEFYLKPNFMKLLTFQIWIDAFENILYTFGPGLGVFIMLGSYNRNNIKVIRQTCLICIISGITSVLVGFMIFAYIGHAAYENSQSHYSNYYFKRLITDDIHLIFSAFPAAMLSLSWATEIWTFLFYVMVAVFGLGTQIVAVEALLTALIDCSTCLKSWGCKRFFLAFIVCAATGGLSLCFVLNNGYYSYQVFRSYSATSYAAIVVCLFECIAIGWAFGTTEFFKKSKFYLQYVPFFVWRIFWVVLTPALLLAALVIEIVNFGPNIYDLNKYPWWNKWIFIWVIVGSSLIWIILFMAFYMCKYKKCTKEAIRADHNVRQGQTSESVPLIKITEVSKTSTTTKPTPV